VAGWWHCRQDPLLAQAAFPPEGPANTAKAARLTPSASKAILQHLATATA